MSAANSNLASWERRLLASVIDAIALVILLVVLLVICIELGISFPLVVAVIPLSYVVYQFAGLMAPHLSFGRTIAGISVVSIRSSGEIRRLQAMLRPAVRVGAITIAFVIATLTDQDWLLALPPLGELVLIAWTPWRQSMADLLAGTLVVNTPQPQPHRAPAGPMYSATDIEFGTVPIGRRPDDLI